MSNALQLTQAALQAPGSLKEVFELEAFRHNCVQNYQKTTGRSDGEIVFERERVLFMKALSDNKKLEQCTRFSIYAAFVELFASGLTLNDGLTYIIPYKDTAQFQIGFKGRLEQMSQMPEVNYVQEPTIVLTNELAEFEYTLGENPRVISHKPAKDRTITKDNKIEFVYLVLDTKFGKRTFLMTRQEVLQIRDTYSVGYKQYVAEAAAQNVELGKPIVKKMSKDGRAWDWVIEPPFWVTNEAEAFKKTLVKRAYKYLPKTPRMKAIDEKIKQYVDREDGTSETTADIDYGIVDDTQKAIAQGNVSSRDERPGNGASADNTATPAKQADESEEQKQKRTRRTKAQIEADAAAKAKTAQPEITVDAKDIATTADGTKFNMSTAEVVSVDGVVDDPNPVDELPDLSGLKF